MDNGVPEGDQWWPARIPRYTPKGTDPVVTERHSLPLESGYLYSSVGIKPRTTPS